MSQTSTPFQDELNFLVKDRFHVHQWLSSGHSAVLDLKGRIVGQVFSSFCEVFDHWFYFLDMAVKDNQHRDVMVQMSFPHMSKTKNEFVASLKDSDTISANVHAMRHTFQQTPKRAENGLPYRFDATVYEVMEI